MIGEPLDRRGFLGAATALAAVPALLAQPAGPRPRPKVGCLSWCFHPFAARADQERAIEIIGEMGFDGIELILLTREDIQDYWTDARIGQMRQQLARHRLVVPQFVIFQNVVEGLSSLEVDVRNQNLDFFEAGCKIAKKLEAPLVNIVAPWPREYQGRGYLPRYYDLPQPKEGEKFRFDIDDRFDWDAVWNGYVGTTKACLERAKQHGLKLTIEHHTHCIIPDAVSFLRLWEAIRDPALGYNLDTGWTLSQREYPPVAIHKVKKHLLNVHVRDIDGLMRTFVHFGTGVMDFPAIVNALLKVGYDGFVSLEQDKHPGDMRATCQRYLDTMRRLIAEGKG